MLSIGNIYLAAIIQGGFQVAVLLLIRRGNRQANRMLALLVGLLVLTLWNMHTYNQGLPAYWRIIDYSNWYSIFFWGPALYLYIGTISGQVQLSVVVLFRHFSFGIFLFVLGTAIYFLKSAGWLASSILEVFNHVRILAFYIQMSLYFLVSFQLLKSYDLGIHDRFSATGKMSLVWLQRLLMIFAVMVTVDLCITVPSVIQGLDEIPYFEVYLFAEAASVFALGYFSLLYNESIFQTIKLKYESSPLNDEISVCLSQKLETVMDTMEPYKNNNLKLDDLAELVEVNPYYLSQIINQQHRKNFYEFINEFRAKSAAELLLKDRGANITTIAYEAGFNNRASFNTAFRKYIGMTPSQYRRNHDHAGEPQAISD